MDKIFLDTSFLISYYNTLDENHLKAEEMMNKKEAYFQKSAQEFWICNEDGELSFYHAQGCLSRSLLFPDFPAAIKK